jgi:hypothetical protein
VFTNVFYFSFNTRVSSINEKVADFLRKEETFMRSHREYRTLHTIHISLNFKKFLPSYSIMSHNDHTIGNSIVSSVEVSLEHLIKPLPNDFDRDRTKLRSFIKQVDSVFELARPLQKAVLLLFAKNEVVGKARDQIDIHCKLTPCEEISHLLLNLYQVKKNSLKCSMLLSAQDE